MIQFIQQTGPYLIKQYFVAWGFAPAEFAAGDSARSSRRAARRRRRNSRTGLPAKPWSELQKTVPPGTLDGFGGPLYPKWQVAVALVRGGTLYYQDAATPYGPYPYPLEMRFGVRSVTKSVFAPLALLRLAQVYGPWVLTLKVGDYVPGLDPKWRRVRFIDAANMATGFGGTGSTKTHPNDIFDGYLGGDYDAWYTAPSFADKIRQIDATLHPYPWEPGTVMRYRDQDYFLLGAAIEGFLKSVRGPQADLVEMVKTEVLTPIGIHQAPAVRTREAGGRDGLVWCNAGYYPTLDDLAKIALLYQARGAHGGAQILNRELTADLLARARRDRQECRCIAGSCGGAPRRLERRWALRDGLSLPALRELDRQRRVSAEHARLGRQRGDPVSEPHGLDRHGEGGRRDTRTGKDALRRGPVTIRAVERLAPF